MTNKEILQKAIEKAVGNGWENSYRFTRKSWHYLLEGNNYYKIIFSHDFAKAFWGYEWKEGDQATTRIDEMLSPMPPRWKYYIKEMVLEKYPLQYLKKFL